MINPVQQAMQVVEAAQREVNELLKDPNLVQNLLGINASFRLIKTRLSFIGGVLEPDTKPKETADFPPITSFMGEAIVRSEKIVSADINPSEARKQAFVAKVDKLEKDILKIAPGTILNSYTQPEDQLALRGVAKRAGVKDYDSRELTTAFIEEVVEGIKKKRELDKKTKKIKDAVDGEPRQVTITQEHLDIDEELKAMGVQPGDLINIYPDGRKEPVDTKGKNTEPNKKDGTGS